MGKPPVSCLYSAHFAVVAPALAGREQELVQGGSWKHQRVSVCCHVVMAEDSVSSLASEGWSPPRRKSLILRQLLRGVQTRTPSPSSTEHCPLVSRCP